jgi:hypothetical protein
MSNGLTHAVADAPNAPQRSPAAAAVLALAPEVAMATSLTQRMAWSSPSSNSIIWSLHYLN